MNHPTVSHQSNPSPPAAIQIKQTKLQTAISKSKKETTNETRVRDRFRYLVDFIPPSELGLELVPQHIVQESGVEQDPRARAHQGALPVEPRDPPRGSAAVVFAAAPGAARFAGLHHAARSGEVEQTKRLCFGRNFGQGTTAANVHIYHICLSWQGGKKGTCIYGLIPKKYSILSPVSILILTFFYLKKKHNFRSSPNLFRIFFYFEKPHTLGSILNLSELFFVSKIIPNFNSCLKSAPVSPSSQNRL